MKQKPILCCSISPTLDTTLFYTGPSLDKGPLPTVFYFSLSGEDSLCKDPFNQPVQFLSEYPLRIFSLDLPAHESNLPPESALSVWAEDLSKKKDIITEFVDKVLFCISYLIEQNICLPNKIAIAGLSRGGYFASHIASKEPRIAHILQFAPLTFLSRTIEFQKISTDPFIRSKDVDYLVDHLYNRAIRFYIGNRDTRVGTENCFIFLKALTEKAFSNHIRSPQIEMIISPSIGRHGHGTGPQTFKNGANWLASCLLTH